MNNMVVQLQHHNHSKIADDAVLALGPCKHGYKSCGEALERGVALCDFLLLLLGKNEDGFEDLTDYWRNVAARYRDTFEEYGRDRLANELLEVKRRLGETSANRSAPSAADRDLVQKILIVSTMPLWRARASEFWDRKLKRGLLSHG